MAAAGAAPRRPSASTERCDACSVTPSAAIGMNAGGHAARELGREEGERLEQEGGDERGVYGREWLRSGIQAPGRAAPALRLGARGPHVARLRALPSDVCGTVVSAMTCGRPLQEAKLRARRVPTGTIAPARFALHL
jgi:hypothetical protein